MAARQNGATETVDAQATLTLLSAVESEPSISQRGLAQRLDAALGLTNAYFKRAVRKGFIKVKQAPARRFLYYLTPLGFLEKARLTHEYLYHSLAFFRRARSEFEELVAKATARGWSRIAIVGASEVAEIASLAAANQSVAFVAVIDPWTNTDRFAGLPVVRDLGELPQVDAVIVTDVKDPQAVYDALRRRLPAERVLHPPILHIAESETAEPPR